MESLNYIWLTALALGLATLPLCLFWYVRRQILAIKVEIADDRNTATLAAKQLERSIGETAEGIETSLHSLRERMDSQSDLLNKVSENAEANAVRLEDSINQVKGTIRAVEERVDPLMPLPEALSEVRSKTEAQIVNICKKIEVSENGFWARLLVEDLKAASKTNITAPLLGLTANRQNRERTLVGQKSAPVVVVAGMRHSGSTALYNIVRLGFEAAGIEVLSNYSEKENIAAEARRSPLPAIVKIHEMRDDVLDLASVILTTKRDLRDTVASAVRRNFFLLEKMTYPPEYAKYNRMLHEVWATYSNYEFNYERFIAEPFEVVKEVVSLLGFDLKFAEEITHKVANLPLDQYQKTLLTAEHITDPEHKLTFMDTLDPADLARIELDHFAWLTRNGYTAPSKKV